MIIKKDAPDFSFFILENDRSRTNLQSVTFDPKTQRLKTGGYIPNMLEFHNLMSDSLEIIAPCTKVACTSDGTNSTPVYDPEGVWFAPDFPNFMLPKTSPLYQDAPRIIPKVITWGVVREEPGTVSGDPFRGTQEIVPRHREYIAVLSDSDSRWVEDEGITGFGKQAHFLEAKGQFFDVLVQYNIWAKSNYEVENLVEWFIDYMRVYRGMFREAGINNMYFSRRVRDDTLMAMNFGYHLRSVLYYFRTERINFSTTSPIKKINLNVSVNDLQATIDKADNRLIDSNLRKIMEKWINKNTFGGN